MIPMSSLRLCRNLALFSGERWDQMGRSASMPNCRRSWPMMCQTKIKEAPGKAEGTCAGDYGR
jgi:hypothetical protein